MPDRTIQRLFLSCQSALDASPQPLKNRQAISAITQCRTRDLGVSFYACPEGHGRWEHCHSCRHRSCYLCAQKRRLEWIEAQKQRLLDVPHFHVIFTLPHEYLSLWRYNEALFARLLFRASQESLQELLADPKYGRVRPRHFDDAAHLGTSANVASAHTLSGDGGWHSRFRRVARSR